MKVISHSANCLLTTVNLAATKLEDASMGNHDQFVILVWGKALHHTMTAHISCHIHHHVTMLCLHLHIINSHTYCILAILSAITAWACRRFSIRSWRRFCTSLWILSSSSIFSRNAVFSSLTAFCLNSFCSESRFRSAWRGVRCFNLYSAKYKRYLAMK